MNAKLIRSKEVVWEELEGQAVLVHTQNGARWTLNAASLEVWNLCDGSCSVESLSKTLAAATRRSLADCREELDQFAQALSRIGLLETHGVDAAKLAAQPVQLSIGTTLGANYHGMNFGSSRRRPSPRGNSGPG